MLFNTSNNKLLKCLKIVFECLKSYWKALQLCFIVCTNPVLNGGVMWGYLQSFPDCPIGMKVLQLSGNFGFWVFVFYRRRWYCVRVWGGYPLLWEPHFVHWRAVYGPLIFKVGWAKYVWTSLWLLKLFSSDLRFFHCTDLLAITVWVHKPDYLSKI